MGAGYKGFKELNCYKEARQLRIEIAALVQTFPSEEKFALSLQIVRASRSITANIAEGYGRYTYNDTRHFFIQARGSVTEILDHLLVANDEHYIDDKILNKLEEKCEVVFRLLNGYIAYLDKEQKNLKKTNY